MAQAVLEGLLLLLLLYAPGHLLGGRLGRKDDGLAELFLLRISASLALAAPLLTLLALAGWFTTPVIGASLAVIAVGAFFVGRGVGGTARFEGRDLLALAGAAGDCALCARAA